MSKRKPPKPAPAPHPGNRSLPNKNQPLEPKAERGPYWLFGHHAMMAALANPRRRFRRLLRLADGSKVQRGLEAGHDRPLWEAVKREEIERLLPQGAVHQGVAALVEPLAEISIADLLALSEGRDNALILILDQVTDPHNVGAILRSAAAFGALGVVLTERHAAPESGTLAKAASGALDIVPLIRVVNLARAMEELQRGRFWIAGLAADGDKTIAEAALAGRIAIAVGAEGTGLRRLTRDYCDHLVRLPTEGPIDQLNVSNAAAIALYELNRR